MMEPWQAIVLALWRRGPLSGGVRAAGYVLGLAVALLAVLWLGEPLSWAVAIGYVAMSFYGAARLEERWTK